MLIFGPLPVFALGASEICTPALESMDLAVRPPYLSRQVSEPVRAAQSLDVGRIVAAGQKLPAKFDDGHYVYLLAEVDGKPYVVWNEVLIPPTNEGGQTKVLAGHVGMVNRLAKTTGGHVNVLGAGQWQVTNGEVSRFDNSAGHYRGNGFNLAYSKQVLEKFGFEVPEVLHLDDYSNFKTVDSRSQVHENNERMHETREFIRSRPPLRRGAEALARAHADYWKRFPQLHLADRPGWIDTDRLFKLRRDAIIDRNKKAGAQAWSPELDRLEAARVVFRLIQTDSPEYAMQRVFSEGDDIADTLQEIDDTFAWYQKNILKRP